MMTVEKDFSDFSYKDATEDEWEENYQEFCDEVWYVYTEEEIRIRRLMESRGYSREKSLGIIRNQVSDQVFREHTDYVIENNGDLKGTRRQIREGIERNETL